MARKINDPNIRQALLRRVSADYDERQAEAAEQRQAAAQTPLVRGVPGLSDRTTIWRMQDLVRQNKQDPAANALARFAHLPGAEISANRGGNITLPPRTELVQRGDTSFVIPTYDYAASPFSFRNISAFVQRNSVFGRNLAADLWTARMEAERDKLEAQKDMDPVEKAQDNMRRMEEYHKNVGKLGTDLVRGFVEQVGLSAGELGVDVASGIAGRELPNARKTLEDLKSGSLIAQNGGSVTYQDMRRDAEAKLEADGFRLTSYDEGILTLGVLGLAVTDLIPGPRGARTALTQTVKNVAKTSTPDIIRQQVQRNLKFDITDAGLTAVRASDDPVFIAQVLQAEKKLADLRKIPVERRTQADVMRATQAEFDIRQSYLSETPTYRRATEFPSTSRQVVSELEVKGKYPEWLSPDLRKRRSVDSALNAWNRGVRPTRGRAVQIFDAIERQVLDRMDLSKDPEYLKVARYTDEARRLEQMVIENRARFKDNPEDYDWIMNNRRVSVAPDYERQFGKYEFGDTTDPAALKVYDNEMAKIMRENGWTIDETGVWADDISAFNRNLVTTTDGLAVQNAAALIANPQIPLVAKGSAYQVWRRGMDERLNGLTRTFLDQHIDVTRFETQTLGRQADNPYAQARGEGITLSEALVTREARIARMRREIEDAGKKLQEEAIIVSQKHGMETLQFNRYVGDYLHALHAPETNLRHGEGAAEGANELLLAEARKYKSAEEFVERVVPKSLESKFTAFRTANKDLRRAQRQGADEIGDVQEAFKQAEVEFHAALEGAEITAEQADFLNKASRQTSTEVELGAKELAPVFIDTSASKSQLTDIWEKAQKAGPANAAGMTNAQAKSILEGIKNHPAGNDIIKHAQKLREFLGDPARDLFEAGYITRAQYDEISAAYQNYVPLYRAKEGVSPSDFVADSFALRPLRERVGSELDVKDIQKNIMDLKRSVQDTLIQHDIDRRLMRLVDEHTAKGMGMVERVKPKFNEDPTLFRQQPDVYSFYTNGEYKYFRFKNPAVALAMKGAFSGAEKEGFMRLLTIPLSWSRGTARFIGQAATSYNLTFGVGNMFRDMGEAYYYLRSEGQISPIGQAQFLRDQLSANKDAWDYVRGLDTPGAKLYKDMVEHGGMSGSITNVIAPNLGQGDFDKLYERLRRGQGINKGQQVMQTIGRNVKAWNDVWEGTTRLNIYKRAIKDGHSPERAGVMAKQATLNFDRKGQATSVMSSLWVFVNAGAQGNDRLARIMRNPRIAAELFLTYGAAEMALNAWNDSVDPDWRKRLSDYERNGKWTMVFKNPTGEGFTHLSIPVPIPFTPIKALFSAGTDVKRGDIDGEQFAGRMKDAVLGAIDPIGGVSQGWQGLAPTGMKPFADVATNTAWHGGPIWNQYEDEELPNYTRAFDSMDDRASSALIKDLATQAYLRTEDWIITIDLNPASVEYVMKQFGAGVYSDVVGTMDYVSALMNEEQPLRSQELPVTRRFYRGFTEEQSEEAVRQADLRQDRRETGKEAKEFRAERDRTLTSLRKIKDVDERVAVLDTLEVENPRLYDAVAAELEKKLLKGKYPKRVLDLRGLEVANGQRAREMNRTLNRLKTPEERLEYLNQAEEAGYLSDTVRRQLGELRQGN